MRVVLDTNVLVSGVVYPASTPGHIVTAWRAGRLDVALSRYILDEMQRVLPRLSRCTLTVAEIRELADLFLFLALVVEPVKVSAKEVRDRNDLPVLGTLLASEADYLITGDKDLLALAQKYPIITPAEFWKRYGE
ncbi:MAG: putative toxin-antitoxin system toxin component, PIN family [Coriobacteriia bacterium]|nr:putative toxin-antitoxin system toxin component, PIN family [Coriobacteriia bacterium]